MKPYSIAVTGTAFDIQRLISCISYGPDELISHSYQVEDSDKTHVIKMNFGSLQVDEDHRIDFFGGKDERLFEFIDAQLEADFKGLIMTLNADDPEAMEHFLGDLFKQVQYLRRHALVVGVTGRDYSSIKTAADHVRACLVDLDAVAPVFSIDPESKQDVGVLVECLLCFARPGIHENSSGKAKFELIE